MKITKRPVKRKLSRTSNIAITDSSTETTDQSEGEYSEKSETLSESFSDSESEEDDACNKVTVEAEK